MKKLFFLFVMMSAAFHSTDAFAKARCPQDMTQSECCASKQTYDLYEAESICGEGNYTIKGVYYAGCYVCASSSNTVICKPGCAKCISAKLCKKCEAGFYLKTGTCYPCSAIAVENGTCTACSSTGTCTAVSCNEGYRANGFKCERITCPAGQYVNGNSCAACPSGTYSEGGTATSCTPCASGTWSPARASNCRACPSISVSNGTCTACSLTGICTAVSCNSGYKANGTTCEKIVCPAHCSSCNVGGYCIQCESGYTLSDDRLSCLPACSENCKTCSNGVCTDCGDGYTLNDGKCLDCSVYNVGNGTCTECDEYGCTDAECNGSNAFFNPTFRKCGVECDVNQYLDSSYTCRDCPVGQTSSGGWFANPTNCYSCDSIPVDGGRCTECKNGSCTKAECEDGYVLDSTGRTCIAALASCLSPLKISDDGCCCVK